MEDSLKAYQRNITMQMEDWLHDPLHRDDSPKSNLIGTAIAVVGTRAALNNKVLHSDEYSAVCKLVQDFALLDAKEADSLTYFAMQAPNNPHLEELSVDIITQEFAESDFIQLLDRIVAILEMDGVLCSEDARLLIDLHSLIQRCVDKGRKRNASQKSELMISIKLFIDSVLEDAETAARNQKPERLKKAS